jgi:two-component system, LytTR family, sensor kinase
MQPRLRGIVRAYLMSIAFWGGMSLLMGLQYQPLNHRNLWPSFLNLLAVAGAHAFALALWTPPIFYLVGKYLGHSRNRLQYVLLWSLGAAPFVLFYIAMLLALTPPYDGSLRKDFPRFVHAWIDLVRTGFADVMFVYIAIVVAAHAYEYLKRVRRQEAERYEYQQALAASELQALKMQLQPHFLFNTLHGIATLADSDPKTAKAMIIKLSTLLRTALERSSSDLIPLESELTFVREYLDLEKMRFGKRLRIEWLVAPETHRLMVPQMILQPLVENAIRHGVAPSRDGGWVEVASSTVNGTLRVDVRNSTGGTPSKGTGVGLRNVEARLNYLYSGDASLAFGVTGDRIAIAALTIPALSSQPAAVREGRHVHISAEGSDPLCVYSSSTTNR